MKKKALQEQEKVVEKSIQRCWWWLWRWWWWWWCAPVLEWPTAGIKRKQVNPREKFQDKKLYSILTSSILAIEAISVAIKQKDLKEIQATYSSSSFSRGVHAIIITLKSKSEARIPTTIQYNMKTLLKWNMYTVITGIPPKTNNI